MESVPELPPLMLGCSAVGVLLLWLAWRRGATTSGLPICYFCSLGTIHFVGAWASTLPAAPSENTSLVAIGFQEVFAGLVAFSFGVCLVENSLSRAQSGVAFSTFLHSQDSGPIAFLNGAARQRPELLGATESNRACSRDAMSRRYVLLGLACALVAPLVGKVPSVAAMVHCGAYLSVVGCCLGAFFALQAGHRAVAFVWIAATCGFPVFTILTSAFIGYGVFAAMMVLCFAFVHYRPRWQATIGAGAICYLGISFYVTYMRDRDGIREAVWGGQAYSARLQRLGQVFARFEFFRASDERQLQSIDDRLNQNYLVGAARAHIDFGLVPLAHGSTIWQAVQGLVPRIVWPGKPVFAGSGNIVSEYTGMTFAEHTSVGVGQVMEFYINFGRWGVIIGLFCFGVVIRWLDWHAARCLEEGNVVGFASWYLPGLAFLQTGGALVDVFGTCAASVLVAWVATSICGSLDRGAV